jgi:hypothetical protein
MIKIDKNDVDFKGGRLEITTDMMVAMIAFIQTEPNGPAAAVGMLSECLLHAAAIAQKAPMEKKTIDKGIIQKAFEELNKDKEAEQ